VEITPRHLGQTVDQSLAHFPVVAISGPRQAGKTTLARLVHAHRGGTFLTLDDPTALEAARRDPVGFLDQPRPLFVDEFQRAGNRLLLAIKADVDGDRRPGSFVLTGSTRFLTVPSLSESLAGRIDVVDLWPFTQGEIEGVRERFIDALLEDPAALPSWAGRGLARRDYIARACRGGFPPIVTGAEGMRRRWFANYVRTVTQRDVRDLARPRRMQDLPRLLRLLAARTAQELNVDQLAGKIGMPRSTVDDYLSLLEGVFLFHRVPAWSRNVTAKVARHPKVHIVDPGLAAHLLGVGPAALASPTSPLAGPLLETFVADELIRSSAWSATEVWIHHFRDRGGPEVDLVLESSDGRVAGIQVTAAASLTARAFRSLSLLRDRMGGSFVHGVVLYTGEAPQRFGDRLVALPISALWAPLDGGAGPSPRRRSAPRKPGLVEAVPPGS